MKQRIKLADRQLPNYSKGEEIFNMVSHIVGAALGIAALVLCIIVSAKHHSGIGVVSSCIYGVTLIVLYTMSSVYHGLRQNDIMITSIIAGILVTTLNTGAYMGETVRAGIKSVDAGQEEGALAMGMSHFKAMLYIIVPQALKNVIPEMCNTFVNNLKMTSVLNVIGVSELFLMAKTAGGAYYKYFESYIVISIIYFVLCFVFNRIFAVVEKKLQGRSDYELATEFLDNE